MPRHIKMIDDLSIHLRNAGAHRSWFPAHEGTYKHKQNKKNEEPKSHKRYVSGNGSGNCSQELLGI